MIWHNDQENLILEELGVLSVNRIKFAHHTVDQHLIVLGMIHHCILVCICPYGAMVVLAAYQVSWGIRFVFASPNF